MEVLITPEAVQFLHHLEDLAMKEDFGLLEAMIDERACFRSNDGDFVGRKAIQAILRRPGEATPQSRRPGFT